MSIPERTIREELADMIIREVVQEIDNINLPALEWYSKQNLTPEQDRIFWQELERMWQS